MNFPFTKTIGTTVVFLFDKRDQNIYKYDLNKVQRPANLFGRYTEPFFQIFR